VSYGCVEKWAGRTLAIYVDDSQKTVDASAPILEPFCSLYEYGAVVQCPNPYDPRIRTSQQAVPRCVTSPSLANHAFRLLLLGGRLAVNCVWTETGVLPCNEILLGKVRAARGAKAEPCRQALVSCWLSGKATAWSCRYECCANLSCLFLDEHIHSVPILSRLRECSVNDEFQTRHWFLRYQDF
jgi:hypothetical protein